MEEMKIKGLKIQATDKSFTIYNAATITNIEKIKDIITEFLDRSDEFYVHTNRSIESFIQEWIFNSYNKNKIDYCFKKKNNIFKELFYKIFTYSAIRKAKKQIIKREKKIKKAQKQWLKKIDKFTKLMSDIYLDFAEYYWDTILTEDEHTKFYLYLYDNILDKRIFNSDKVLNAERIIHHPIDKQEKQQMFESKKIEYSFLRAFKPHWNYWSSCIEDPLPYICICGIFIIAHALMIDWPIEDVYKIYYRDEIYDIVQNKKQIRYLEDIIFKGVQYYE